MWKVALRNLLRVFLPEVYRLLFPRDLATGLSRTGQQPERRKDWVNPLSNKFHL